MFEQSYLTKRFTVADPNARIRQASNLMAFEMTGGSFRTIPKGTAVRIDEVRIVQGGANKASLFGRAINAICYYVRYHRHVGHFCPCTPEVIAA